MPAQHATEKAIDHIQQRLTDYSCALHYADLPAEVVHAAKVRIIDALGALIGGFFGEPCLIARNLAAQLPLSNGVSIIGTRMKTTVDMAAFVNAVTARHVELTDSYHRPGSYMGHASDTLTPVYSAAEYARSNGPQFITAVVLSYEIFLRISDVFHNWGFDFTNFACIANAAAAGKLLGLTQGQLAHCISMAAVANVTLRQVREGHLTMFKSAASGQAGRAGVFAALLARAGMEGPHLPFEGKAGWCDHVARDRFSLNEMGGNGEPFRILETQIKIRPSAGNSIASILAAEKIAPLDIKNVQKVTVEAYQRAKDSMGTAEHCWNPESKETADHSIPYVVATTLMDGTITPRSFNDAHLWNPELRALMQKIEVIGNDEFTQAYKRLPQEHRVRVTVVTKTGERLVGETGGGHDDLAAPRSDTEIVSKFRGLTEDVLGAKRTAAILDRLWHLEDMHDVAEIAPALVLD
jgi:2-methylcitrate dehydratase